jgi:O-antigen/teichoic acid export membrane protein
VRAARAVQAVREHPPADPPSLRGDVVVSVASRGLLLVSGLVAGVVTARGLGTSGRGLLALATTIPTVLVVLAGLGAPLAASYLLARGEERLRVLSRAGSLLALYGSAGTAAAVLAVMASGWDQVWFAGLGRGLLVLACLLVPPSLLAATLIGLLRGSGRLRTASAVELAQGALSAVATVLAVTVAHGGPAAVVVAQLGGVLAGVVLAGVALRADGLSLTPRASRTVLGRMLGFGLRADLGNAMHVSGFRLDTFLVNGYTGSAALGVYAVATRFAELLFVLPFAVSVVVMPRGVRDRAHGRVDETPRVFTWTLITSCAAAVVLAMAGGPLLRLLYSARYDGAYRPFVILLAGVVVFGATNVLMNDVVGRGHPGLVSAIAAVGLVLTVGLDLWLVPGYGITGAAAASTVVYVVDAALAVACYARVSGRHPLSLLALGSPGPAPGVSR